MPEPSKRVVVQGLPAAEAQFATYVGKRLEAERSTGDLEREAVDLERQAHELEAQLGPAATGPTSLGDLGLIEAELGRASDLLGGE